VYKLLDTKTLQTTSEIRSGNRCGSCDFFGHFAVLINRLSPPKGCIWSCEIAGKIAPYTSSRGSI
jgi:hypothetical protein